MNIKKFIAFLLSLLLFPGLGQLYLKRKKEGIIFVSLTSLVLLLMIIHFEFHLYQEMKAIKDPSEMIFQAAVYVRELLSRNAIFYKGGILLIGFLWVSSVVEILIYKDPKKDLKQITS